MKIDASNAGIILDGSNIGEDFVPCLQIISDGNAVRGLQFVNFAPSAGISLSGGAQHNLIGGDRHIGSGPLGQGNLASRGDKRKRKQRHKGRPSSRHYLSSSIPQIEKGARITSRPLIFYP